jgi:hypothetical protein
MSTGYSEQSHQLPEPLEQQLSNAMVEDEDPPAKKKRRKVNHACLYCRRSHMTCDDGRPCQRWYAYFICFSAALHANVQITDERRISPFSIKRDIGHLCRDEAKPLPSGKPPMVASAPGGIPPPNIPRQGTMRETHLHPLPMLCGLTTSLFRALNHVYTRSSRLSVPYAGHRP